MTKLMAPTQIATVWQTFNDFPMETISKAFVYSQRGKGVQRTVQEMKEDRIRFGSSGNCFDLSIWLIDELEKNQIEAYAIGHDLGTPKGHVSVIAVENGKRYFCDLGDMWIQPICLDEIDNNDWNEGFFPAAKVKFLIEGEDVRFHFLRPNGKISEQTLSLTPITSKELLEAAEMSQRFFKRPLVEMRMYSPEEIYHWEFDDHHSFISKNEGLFPQEEMGTMEEMVDRIAFYTKMEKNFVKIALSQYKKLRE